MESKEFYIKRLMTTFGICIIGLILAETVFKGFELFHGSALLTAFLFAGMPFGWMILAYRLIRDITQLIIVYRAERRSMVS